MNLNCIIKPFSLCSGAAAKRKLIALVMMVTLAVAVRPAAAMESNYEPNRDISTWLWINTMYFVPLAAEAANKIGWEKITADDGAWLRFRGAYELWGFTPEQAKREFARAASYSLPQDFLPIKKARMGEVEKNWEAAKRLNREWITKWDTDEWREHFAGLTPLKEQVMSNLSKLFDYDHMAAAKAWQDCGAAKNDPAKQLRLARQAAAAGYPPAVAWMYAAYKRGNTYHGMPVTTVPALRAALVKCSRSGLVGDDRCRIWLSQWVSTGTAADDVEAYDALGAGGK